EAEPRSKCDVLILPDVRGFSTFGFTRASEVIARGEVAARAALPLIEAALAQRRVSRRPTAPRAPVVEPESVLVTAVRFDPAGLVPGGFLSGTLGVPPGPPPFGFTRASEVIARGEVAARAALPLIEAALAQRRVSRRPTAPRAPVVEPESVLVTAVRFDPAGLVPEGFLSRTLGVRPGT